MLATWPHTCHIPAGRPFFTLRHPLAPKNRLNLLSLKIVPLLLKLSSSKSGTIRKLVASCVAAISEMGMVVIVWLSIISRYGMSIVFDSCFTPLT